MEVRCFVSVVEFAHSERLYSFFPRFACHLQRRQGPVAQPQLIITVMFLAPFVSGRFVGLFEHASEGSRVEIPRHEATSIATGNDLCL